MEKLRLKWCKLDSKLVDAGADTTRPPAARGVDVEAQAEPGAGIESETAGRTSIAGPYTPGCSWEDINHEDVPELIVCCAASRVGLAPTGVSSESFAISPVSVVHRTNRSRRTPESQPSDDRPLQLPTSEFVERLDSAALIPLQGPAGWMSTSGAAFASAMGRKALGSTGALLAAFNVDLGIWLPSLQYAYDATDLPPVALGNLVSEIFGFYDETGVHTFVSDGGHFENLGLTELLQRRESEPSGLDHDYILCFDASNDESLTFKTLRDALNVADVTLGQRLEFDLSELPAHDSNQPTKTAVYRIPFWPYPKVGDTSPIGTIVYAKLQAAQDQPRNIRRYVNTNSGAPRVSTGNQLLTDEHFLFLVLAGFAAATQACEEIKKLPRAAPAGVHKV